MIRRDRSSGARRSRAMRIVAAAALCTCALQCGGDPGPEASARGRSAAFVPFDTGTGRAIGFLARPATLYSHAGYYFLDFLHRRFAIAAFAGNADRYRVFRSHPTVPIRGIEPFERLIDPEVSAQQIDLASAPHPVDRLTIDALYCAEVPIADDYGSRMRDMISEGGYALTHVALALVSLDENGCAPRWPALRSEVAQKMAASVRSDDRLDDIELESAGFLYYLGRGDLVPRDFPASVLRLQNADGGWAEYSSAESQSSPSNWHPTVFALWVLLESEGRGNRAPMIPPRLQ